MALKSHLTTRRNHNFNFNPTDLTLTLLWVTGMWVTAMVYTLLLIEQILFLVGVFQVVIMIVYD